MQLDTETLYTVVTQEILDEVSPGKIYTWDVKVGLMGLQKEAVSRKIVEIYDLPITWEEYAEKAQERIEIVMRNCSLMPGKVEDRRTNFLFFLFFFFYFNATKIPRKFTRI